jgi:hypothetical protein
MRWLRQDLHLSASVFSAVYALQLASAVPSLVAARCGALFVGRGGAEVQSTGSIARCFHGPSLVERCGRLSKRGSFLRQMMVRVARRLAFTDSRQDEAAFLSWLTPVLELLRPLRL